ncbi:hypothetical protein ACCO45_002784 [Purpureocillium lilacinum]|uniref:Uncharacterized protein n=1 Tax=Purpureocillium lilacinum TaxID=33203 RepID=A0ACC4DY06_PURLI
MARHNWDNHKAEVERLFIRENRPLDEVIGILASSHDFHASKAQFERKLKEWGLRKNRMKKGDWKVISAKLAKRKRETGKDYEIYIDGVRCPSPKVRKETARHGYVSTIEKLRPPEASVTCTQDGPQTYFSNARLLMSDVSPTTGRHMANQLRLVFERSVPSARVPSAMAHTDCVSKVSAMLSTIMPEEYDGQLAETAQRLCASQTTTNVPDWLLVKLFLLSNKFDFWDIDDDTPLTGRARRHDEDVIGIMQSMELCNPHQFRKFYLQDSHTSAAIVEQLFASVVRTQSLATLRMMLDAGVSPDLPIDIAPWLVCQKRSPLVYAAGLKDDPSALALSDILLRYGASINEKTGMSSALSAAIDEDHRNLIFKLIGADKGGTLEMVDSIIKATGRPEYFAERTPLGRAVELGDLQQAEKILSSGVDINSREPINWDDTEVCMYWPGTAWKVTTPLGLAANSGNVGMIARLLRSGAKIDMPHSPWVCPLLLALSRRGNQDGAAMLLRAGADVCAAEANAASLDEYGRLFDLIDFQGLGPWLCKSLIDQGASVGASHLLQAAQKHNLDVFSIMLARVKNDRRDSCGDTLRYALEAGKTEIILKMHLENVPLGQHLSSMPARVSDVKMLDTLEEIGLLQSDGALAESILSWAIRDNREDLVRRLLALNIKFRYHELGESVAPLDSAISCSNLELAQLIIQRGAAISENALYSAVWESLRASDTSILQALLDYAARSTKYSFLQVPCCTAYYMAVLGRSGAILQMLFNAGIDPGGNSFRFKNNAIDFAGLNFECCEARRETRACHCVQWEPHWWRPSAQDLQRPQLRSVLEAGVQVGDRSILCTLLRGALWSRTHLGGALCEAISAGKAYLVDDLLDAGADVNCTTEDGRATALGLAVCNKDVALVKRLLSLGAQDLAPPSARSRARTALQEAVVVRHIELVNILLGAGANVNAMAAEISGATALQFAAIRGYLGIPRRLLDAGADVNAQRAEIGGRTALQGAAEHGRLDMISLLLNSGARVEGYSYRREYVRAVRLAEINGHMSAAKFLKVQCGWDEWDSCLDNDEDFDSDEEGSQPSSSESEDDED